MDDKLIQERIQEVKDLISCCEFEIAELENELEYLEMLVEEIKNGK